MLEAIGALTPEEESIPDNLQDPVYFAVWSSYQLIGKKQKQDIVEKILADGLEPSKILDVYKQICDEAAVTEEEISELAEKRFGRALPMESVNLIVLMEMH